MLLPELREEVLNANREIARRGLAPHTFGNASGISRSHAEPLVVIKPSGVDYDNLTAADLVITNLNGEIVEGDLRPSSDLDTHTLLYREFPGIGGIVHTHSEFATSWAQACRPIPCFGTTHADYFHGPVPVTEPLTAEEVAEGYVRNTGAVIVRRFRSGSLDPLAVPGILVAGHAPFAWGKTACRSRRARRCSGVHCPLGLPHSLASPKPCSRTAPNCPNLKFQSTFPSTTTNGNTAQKPLTASPEPTFHPAPATWLRPITTVRSSDYRFP